MQKTQARMATPYQTRYVVFLTNDNPTSYILQMHKINEFLVNYSDRAKQCGFFVANQSNIDQKVDEALDLCRTSDAVLLISYEDHHFRTDTWCQRHLIHVSKVRCVECPWLQDDYGNQYIDKFIHYPKQ